MLLRGFALLAWLDGPSAWVTERSPHRDAADWAMQGPALPILALTLLHFGLRLLDRVGWIRYDSGRLLAGLRGAAVAVNALFQPHARDPEAGRTRVIHVDRHGDPPSSPTPDLANEHEFADDGLRRRSRARFVDATADASISVEKTRTSPDTSRTGRGSHREPA